MTDLPCRTPSLLVRPTIAPPSPAFESLFAALDRHRGAPSLPHIERCLSDASLDLADVLPHAACDRGTYVRTLVRATGRYHVLVMCWLPGQQSPVHDHGGSACGVRIVQGAATETLYVLADDGFADAVSRRVLYAGDVLCAEDDDVHALGNLVRAGRDHRPVALVTVHVYAPALINSRKYVDRASLAAARVA